ncbi:DEAD/DEAH box helicase [bacterium]|nr:DEAD/DEAH box helicase [bacterium]
MRIASLEAYNAPPQLIRVWEEAYGQELLPVQEAAVARHGVLAGRNLIVQAPTSAGKTFVGEMAATRAALAGRKVLYLVPTKALAEDKFAHFTALYSSLGLRIIVTTRDRRQDDRRFTSGDFDIALAIPEKVRALWARGGVSQFLGLAVIDELQTLSEPERGPCLELLLGELRRLAQAKRGEGLQIVGLSACLGASPRLADYLGAEWLETNERPVELRKGVLVGNHFSYVGAQGRMVEERLEGFAAADDDNANDTAARLALHFARRKEPTILFVRDRATALRLALAVAERLEDATSVVRAFSPQRGGTDQETGGGVEARTARDGEDAGPHALADLERTAVREQLQRLMACGVAFHSADLQCEDRRAVEQAFAAGEVLVLCSTPTLALGVNLPARNVIIDPHGWQSEIAGAPSALSPISRADFENRAGRAGRLGSGGFGRGILLADSDLAAEALAARYLRSTFSPPEPALMGLQPAEAALTIAAGAAMRGASLDEVYAGTFSAYLQSRAELPDSIREVLTRCRDSGLVHTIGARVAPTSLGQRAAAAGVCFETFCWLAAWAARPRPPTELEATFIAAMTAEAREAGPPGGGGRSDYLEALRRHAGELGQDGELLEELLGDQRHDWRVRERAARTVLTLYRWLGSEDTYEVERGVRLAAARLGHLGEVVGWLVETLADIGLERGWRAASTEGLRRHAECLGHGLTPEELPLARLTCFGLGRDHARQLAQAGLQEAREIVAAGQERLAEILPGRVAREVLAAAQRRVGGPGRSAPRDVSGGPGSPAPREAEAPPLPALVLSHDRPDLAVFFGQPVPLRPAEFRLLHTLAEKPGKCVSYEVLYDRMWGEPLAEPGQIYAHRSRLCGKLAQAFPDRDAREIVTTIPRHGLMLNLPPQEVVLS